MNPIWGLRRGRSKMVRKNVVRMRRQVAVIVMMGAMLAFFMLMINQVSQQDRVACACLNGGVCSGGACDCSGTGYAGAMCEMDVDECLAAPCLNGGVCTNTLGSFTCDCSAVDFGGPTCSVPIDDCAVNPCLNGGVCVDGVRSSTCDCTGTGFTGALCETNIDACAPVNPCANGGVCTDGLGPGNYTCDCTGTGFTGPMCMSNVNDCTPSSCSNGGTCIDGVNTFTCDCTGTGFTGATCTSNIDDCTPSSCSNGGVCIDGVNSFTCDCTGTGFDGATCTNNIDDCAGMPCQNGGACVDGISSFECICVPPTYGTLCENTAAIDLSITSAANAPLVIDPSASSADITLDVEYFIETVGGANISSTDTPIPQPFTSDPVSWSYILAPGDVVVAVVYDNTTELLRAEFEYYAMPARLIDGFGATPPCWNGTDYCNEYPLQMGSIIGPLAYDVADFAAYYNTVPSPPLDVPFEVDITTGQPRALSSVIGAVVPNVVRIGLPSTYFILNYTIPSDNFEFRTTFSSRQDPSLFSVGGGTIEIDWGDGSPAFITSFIDFGFGGNLYQNVEFSGQNNQHWRHEYATAGEYTVKYAGRTSNFDRCAVSIYAPACCSVPRPKISDILQFGTTVDRRMNFCNDVTKVGPISATDAPPTSLLFIDNMFANGFGTFTYDMASWSFPNARTAVNAFPGARNLGSLPNLDLSSLEDGYRMFAGATVDTDPGLSVWGGNLGSLTRNGIFAETIIPASTTLQFQPGMTVANQLFRGATIENSASIDLSLVSSALVNVDELFYQATFTNPPALSTLALPAATTAVRAFGAINNLGSLASLQLTNLQNALGMFQFSSWPTVAPSTSAWQLNNLQDAESMWLGCGGAAFAIDSSTWGMSSLQRLVSTFRDTDVITTLDVSAWNTAQLQEMSSPWEFSTITSVDVSMWSTPLLEDMSSAFADTSTTVNGINSLQTANVDNLFSTFERYTGGPVDVSSWDTSMVVAASFAFANLVVTPVGPVSWNTASLVFADAMFERSNGRVDVSVWTLTALMDIDNFADECFLSQAEYDALLIAVDATGLTGGTLGRVRSNAVVDVTVATPTPARVAQFYTAAPSAAATAHANLIGKGWTLNDGGPI